MKHYIFDLDDTLYINPKDIKKMYNVYPDNNLANLLNNCPHKKYIYTNATYDHANIIINKLNINNHFNKIYSRDTIPSMKPMIQSARDVENNIIFYEKETNFNKNNEFVFFDDLLPNLKTAKIKGWKTIWISPFYNHKNNYNYLDYSFPNINIALEFCNQNDI